MKPNQPEVMQGAELMQHLSGLQAMQPAMGDPAGQVINNFVQQNNLQQEVQQAPQAKAAFNINLDTPGM